MLTVIAGGMFSEKSTELQRRGKRLERAGKKVAYFKPDFDNRYSENEIVTHDGKKVVAKNIPLNTPVDLLMELDLDTEVILIDEIQFFDTEIIEVINLLVNVHEVTVIVAGLDLDFEGRPFNITAYLMAIAEEVVKLQAVCSSCGTDSWVSYKEPNGKRIELGTDEYKPMCRKCFNKKLQGAN
jgi:thymidine kinase